MEFFILIGWIICCIIIGVFAKTRPARLRLVRTRALHLAAARGRGVISAAKEFIATIDGRKIRSRTRFNTPVRECPHCGTPMPITASFCLECRRELMPVSVAQQQQAAEAAAEAANERTWGIANNIICIVLLLIGLVALMLFITGIKAYADGPQLYHGLEALPFHGLNFTPWPDGHGVFCRSVLHHGNGGRWPATMAVTNKCLAQSNKQPDGRDGNVILCGDALRCCV